MLEFFTNHFSHGRHTKSSPRIIRLSKVLPELKVSAPSASLLGDESQSAHVCKEFLGMGRRRADDFHQVLRHSGQFVVRLVCMKMISMLTIRLGDSGSRSYLSASANTGSRRHRR